MDRGSALELLCLASRAQKLTSARSRTQQNGWRKKTDKNGRGEWYAMKCTKDTLEFCDQISNMGGLVRHVQLEPD